MDETRITNWLAVAGLVPTSHSEPYPFISPSNADLTGKSVFISGASRGIGRATAISFARAGASRIAIAARTDLQTLKAELHAAAREAGRSKPQVLPIQLDVTCQGEVSNAASQVFHAFGGSLDVLVNNAGRCETMNQVTESQVEDFWSTWEVNIKGVYLLCRSFIPLLLKSSTKTLLIVSSAGANILLDGVAGYHTSKFALCRFTEYLAVDYQERGLVAISTHPGSVLTEITAVAPPEARQFLKDSPYLGAETLVWLAKEQRTWLSGRFLSCNWDMSELEEKKEDILERDLLKFRLTI